MDAYSLAILACLPIAVAGLFVVGLRWPASRAMPLSYATVFVLALFVWQVDTLQVVAATIKGLFVAATGQKDARPVEHGVEAVLALG